MTNGHMLHRTSLLVHIILSNKSEIEYQVSMFEIVAMMLDVAIEQSDLFFLV